MDEYYVYCYLDPRKPGNFIYENLKFDHEPFYIGKGIGKRINEHVRISQIKRDKNKHKSNKIQKILIDNLKPIKIKIYSNLNENDALIKEMEIINLIGRMDMNKGPLTNLTNGGENNWVRFKDLGLEKQQEIRERNSKRMKENNPMKNPEVAKKCAKSKTGKRYSEEYKSNMSKILLQSKNHKDSVRSQENREKHRKLQEKNMKPIIQYDTNMNYICEYVSVCEATRKTNVKKSYISAVINHRQKSTHGFIFTLK